MKWLAEAVQPLSGNVMGRAITITGEQKQQFLEDINRFALYEVLGHFWRTTMWLSGLVFVMHVAPLNVHYTIVSAVYN